MSCFDVHILEPSINILEIETCIGNEPSSIDVITYDNISAVEVSHCVALLPSDINELITVKDIIGNSGILVSNNSGIYSISLSNSELCSSNIIDLLSSVQYIIGNSGLISGDYTLITYNSGTGLTQIAITGLQPSGNYSLMGHNHYSNDIIDWNTSISGLLPAITGSQYALVSFDNNIYHIDISGLQPSGNYSSIGHTHTSSYITNFDSAVSGLIPVKNINAGSGINVVISSGNATISVTGSFGLTSEEVDDRVSQLLVPGNYIDLNYNDASNILTIAVTGLQPTGNYSLVGHSHTSNSITDFSTAVSGLLPPTTVTSISGVSGILINNSGTNYTISLQNPTVELIDITDLSNNARIFLLDSSSNNLFSLLTNKTGSGLVVFNNNPEFTGIPTAPTAPSGTNNYQIANTAFVRNEITNLIDAAPNTLDTLNELAAALGDDPNFATTMINTLATKANLAGASFTGSVIIPSGSANFDALTVNNVNVSISGHNHNYTDIINFSSGVDAALSTALVGGSNIYLYKDTLLNTLSINATGVSIIGHGHSVNDINNFDTSVSGLLPVKNIVEGNYINVINNGSGIYTISSTGLQPSGNYSLIGHTHTSSHIINFDTAVSGLLPVKNISAGSGIGITSTSGDFTVSVTGTFGLTGEEVDNRVSNLLVAGNYIDLDYNDLANSLTIAVTGLQPSGNYSVVGHTHTSLDITDFDSAVSGLIPPSNFTSLSGISGIVVINSGTNYFVGLNDPTIQLADITDLTPAAQTFLLTSSSTNLSSLMIDKTGSGVLVFNDSPAFSGIPTVPTASSGTNTDQIASTAFVRNEISNLVDSAPITLDTLNELAAALGDDPNFATTVTNTLAGKASLSGAIFTGPITIPSGTGNFNNLTVNSINVSVSGHTHLSTDITDSTSFGRNILTAPSYAAQNKLSWQIVSNNITAAAGGQYLLTTNTAYPSTLTITDPSSPSNGDWYVVIKPSGAGGAIGGTIIGGVSYNSASGVYLYRVYSADSIFSSSWKTYTLDKLHYHTSSDITNFNSSVSGLLPSITGTGYITSSFASNTYTIGVTGLQPSGNYSLVGHTHTSSDITDFNSSVSGLIPVKNILSGTGITVYNASGIYTIEATGSGVLSDQAKSLVTTVFNNTGSPIPKMTAVYINGGQGDMPTVALAIATTDMTSAGTYGLTYEAIPNMESGQVIVFGALTGLNTDQFNPTAPVGNVNGSVLYLSPSISGALTLTKPSAPNHIVAIGTIVRTHQNEGIIEVRVQNGFELEELHNVAISGVINGQFLQYNSGTQLWIPSSSGNFQYLSVSGTVVSISGHTHAASNITDFNSSVSGLLPSVNSSGYVTTLFANNTYTVSVTGLQPSGNYSIVGHTHTSNNITDFNSGVSGLLPVKDIIAGTNISISSSSGNYTINSTGGGGNGITITNYGSDRILTSDGTSSGIISENSLLFDNNLKTLTIIHDKSEGLVSNESVVSIQAYDNTNDAETSGRLEFIRNRGTLSNPSGVINNDTLGIIRINSISQSGTNQTVGLIRFVADGTPSGVNLYTPTRLRLSTSSGPGMIDNILVLYSDGKLSHNGYMTIDNGLSSPTPVYSLGTISGNTAISYGVDRQIQTATLNGTSVNFTQGTGWDVANRSMDVMLVLTVNSTTTISWSLVDDQYNAFPIFSPGTYLILLRSIGTTIQGHYIGNKTN